jgi:hypothetical protein
MSVPVRMGFRVAGVGATSDISVTYLSSLMILLHNLTWLFVGRTAAGEEIRPFDKAQELHHTTPYYTVAERFDKFNHRSND